MQDKFQNRRRNYFIKKEFQRNFIIKFCILVIIGSVMSGLIVYTMSRSTVTTTFEDCRLKIKSTADFILPAVLLSGTIVVGIIGLATVAITLFTSHKIAGPLYHLEKDVEELSTGNFNIRFNLRRGDEIKALAESFNKMTQSVKTKLTDIKNAVSELESVLEINGEISKGVREKMQDLKTTLSKFNT